MPALTPTLETHVPVLVELPAEANDLAVGRPDIPPPNLWQSSVKVRRKLDGKVAIVARVDLSTMMFRAYYPDEGDVDPETGKPKGRYADRTDWERCENWDPEVTFSPAELRRQEAQASLDAEIAQLDKDELAAVSVLVDGDDPNKGLAKLEALRRLGILKAKPETAAAAVAAVNPGPKKAGK